MASQDESFVVRDAVVTRVWAPVGRRPICRVTGSHERTVVYGAIDMQGRQLFRQYPDFDGRCFLDYLKKLHSRYGRLYLFLDRAKQHYRTKKVREYMSRNRDTLRVRWIPVGSPAFNVMEECWRQMDSDDILALKVYSSIGRLRVEIGEYLRTKRFRLDVKSFLLTSRYDGGGGVMSSKRRSLFPQIHFDVERKLMGDMVNEVGDGRARDSGSPTRSA